MSLSHDYLLSNIKRQAKRLSKNIEIPLGKSQEMLGHDFYQCKGWKGLCEEIKKPSFESDILLLTNLNPGSDTFLFKLLSSHINVITANIQLSEVTELPKEEIKKIIVSSFGLDFQEYLLKIK